MNKHTIFALLVTLMILMSASTSFAQNTNENLRFNGVYQSQKIGIVNDSHYYLKFFPDGTVLRTYGDLTKESVADIKRRLVQANSGRTIGNAQVSSARYLKIGSRVNFTFGTQFKESYGMSIINFGLTGRYTGSLVKRDERYTFLPDLASPSELFSNSNSSSNSSPSTGRVSQLLSLNSSQPKIYAVLVGVADYKHISALRYTDDDAFRLYAFLKSPEGGALPDNQIEVLIDEAATQAKIVAAMRRQFLKAGPNDLILFFFSGHGAPGSFAPVDFDGRYNLLSHSSIRSIFDQSNAKHKVIIADACHSGSLNKGVKSGYDAVSSYYSGLTNTAGGLALFMSSKAEETSIEVAGLRQSVFTYYLLEGLKGKADVNYNKVVTISELYDYVQKNVRSYSANRQSPVINGTYDRNMPLGVVR
jgi:hypothetical protein